MLRSVMLVGVVACASAFHMAPGSLLHQRSAHRQVGLSFLWLDRAIEQLTMGKLDDFFVSTRWQRSKG